MYRLGEVKHSHRKAYILLACFVMLALGFTIIAVRFLKPETDLGKTPTAVTTKISYQERQTKAFTEPLFTINLPTDWQAIPPTNDPPQPTYTWHGTSKENSARMLNIFLDKDVSTLAVNRELYVQANGSAITVLGDVSDNCTTFTGTATATHGSTPAKWQGIDFLCDSGNYERDVVGVASPDGLNRLILSGTSGNHHFFFTYIDNSASPDYSIFTNALKSLKLK